MEVFVAPMQGFTDAPFCRFHADVYGSGVDVYGSPFLRVERGEVRRRDIRNISSPLLGGLAYLPQALFKDVRELRMIADAVADAGYRSLDLNLGCPFPPQVNHGRGAALLRRDDLLAEVVETVKSMPGIRFSVKMRLGVETPYEWRGIVGHINAMPLEHVTIHPRVAVQQYGGELFMAEFEALMDVLVHPVVYNGDIATPGQLDSIICKYPNLAGVMVGRGLMARHSLVAEWHSNSEWTRQQRLERLLEFHRRLYSHYCDVLCGEMQVLMKVRPFWDYLEPEIGHKAMKAIKKASSLRKYEAAVAAIV